MDSGFLFDWLLPDDSAPSTSDEWLNADAVFQFDGNEEDAARFLSDLDVREPQSATQQLHEQQPVGLKKVEESSSLDAVLRQTTGPSTGVEKKVALDDKRRRNTAASARFRAKKKLREMALEKTAKEMVAKAEMLERRLHEYEMEIKWLRQLVTEQVPTKSLQQLYDEHHIPFHDEVTTAGAGVERTIGGSFAPILPAPPSIKHL
ncbi:hypothetical protein HDU96_006046 [Phlyctochytrium bullatum]|nr:hypothetical protein HDU96_006046 [Phlyctochytrium bullatum]